MVVYEPHINGTRWGFTCATTQIGPVNYRASGTTFLVFREQVRNLRWCCSGRDGENSNCPTGTVFIIPAFVKLTIDWPEPTEVLIGHFDGQILLDVFFENIWKHEIKNFGSAAKFLCKECLPISNMIWDEIRMRGEGDEPYLRALGLVLMHTIARSAPGNRISTDSKAGLSKLACHRIETYLSQNFHQPVSVRDMADLVGISAGHFSTSFRNSFGQTPHQYLMGLKLDEAERLLKKTSMSIRDIARHLSFSSQSHLTTALRKYRQLTPGELRK